MPMSSITLIQSLAGDLMADPGILFETIREEEDILRVIRSYKSGDFTYEQVLDTMKNYI